jgi:hypothetical protein
MTAATACRLYYRSYVNCPVVGHYVDGWRNFTKGFYYDWIEDGDATSKNDAVLMAKLGKFSQAQHTADLPGWLTTPSSVDISREIAYAISAWNVAKDIGDPDFVGRDPYLDLAYYQLDTWKTYLQGYPGSTYPGEQSAQYQPFMFALTCEALITIYKRSDTLQADRDKILTKIRDVANLTYDKLYSDTNHAFIANTGNPTTYWPSINLLIVPLYGWLWHETGEQYYFDAGDKIFSDGVIFGWPEVWGGKQFSQNYRWSFDYVSWRQQDPVTVSTNADALAIEPGGSGLVVSWQSVSNRLYSMQSTTNLFSPWTNLQGFTDHPSPGGLMTWTNGSTPEPQEFYRLGIRTIQ